MRTQTKHCLRLVFRTVRCAAMAEAVINGKARSLAIIRQIRWRHIRRELLAAPVTFVLLSALPRLHPALSWNVYGSSRDTRLLWRQDSRQLHEITTMEIGLRVATALLQPYYAADREERWFRDGTTTSFQATWRSALFALAHLPSGQKLHVIFTTFVGGLWLSHLYRRHGLEEAIIQHATHDLLVASGAIGLTTAAKLSPRLRIAIG